MEKEEFEKMIKTLKNGGIKTLSDDVIELSEEKFIKTQYKILQYIAKGYEHIILNYSDFVDMINNLIEGK